MQRNAGFTLIELMMAVAIAGILAAIAYPSYQNYVLRTGRSDGQALLMQVMQAQERFFSQNQTYTTNLGAGGLALGGAADAAMVSEDGRYQVTGGTCGGGTTIGNCVRLTATPQGRQADDARCANLTLDSRGTKGISGTSDVQTCW